MSPIRSRVLRLLPVLALPVVALVAGQSVSASAPPTVPTVPGGSTTVESLPEGYVRLIDDTGNLTVVVPDTWTIIDTAPIVDEVDPTLQQPYIFASGVDPQTFHDTFATGVLYTALPYQADAEAVITDGGLSAGCESIAVQPYTDPVFTGFVQVGTNCGEGGGTWNMIVASPADMSFTALVQVQIETPADQLGFDAVLSSFTYAGDPTIPPGLLVPTVPGSSVPG